MAENILEEAQRLITGDRNHSYDHPLDNFRRIATGWEVILNTKVTPEQVALCMVWTKVARQVYRDKRDNLVDAAGYLGTVEMVQNEMERRNLEGEE